ncbi:MAG TPA: hypothetical protein VIQ77_01750 [Mucilaginibacter sp.]|jgi:hypothetical protein
MQQEFTVPLYLKIFYYLLGAAVVGAGLFMFTLPDNGSRAIYFFPVFLTVTGLIIITNAALKKVIIEDGTITVKGILKTRQIAVNDVKGIRFGRKVIYLVPDNTDRAAISIRNYNVLSNNNAQLANYLMGTFADLNAVDQDDEQKSLLQDTNLGFTVEERQAKLNNAKKVAIAYNALGVVVAATCVVLKQPVFTILALIYPLLGIALILTGNGSIKFLSSRKRSLSPFVIVGFIAPAIALFAKSLALYHIYSFDNFWLPFIGIGLTVGGTLFKIGFNQSLASSMAAQGTLMLAIALFYAFGIVRSVNCAFDNSPDHIYKASVLGHHISHGKHTAYYLYLSTWGPCHEQKQIDVGGKMYYNTPVGGSVKIDLKAGLLHIPWFVVSR